MSYQCFKCNAVEVAEEFQRCNSCEAEHRELAKKLDERPKTHEKKVKEKLYPIKKIRQGIECTDWISREDAMNMGIILSQE